LVLVQFSSLVEQHNGSCPGDWILESLVHEAGYVQRD
jgi:hypothetical protein